MTSPIPPFEPGGAQPHDAQLDAGLRALHQELLREALPATLLAAAERVQVRHQQAAQSRHWMGMAASLLLAFGVGWLGHGQWVLPAATALAQRGSLEHEFVRQASLAYAVYQPEKRHPVEVGATEEAHLVQWLSKRLGKPLKIPNLEPLGFALVGGRLLPGESGARAQFMFQNAGAQRITLYLGSLEQSAAAATQATQFRFEPSAPVPSFYWAEQGFGYALSGPVDKATLMALADSVYAQVNRD
jgi:anti-sigma factor RsiW